jgi:hypothetical protein
MYKTKDFVEALQLTVQQKAQQPRSRGPTASLKIVYMRRARPCLHCHQLTTKSMTLLSKWSQFRKRAASSAAGLSGH